MRSDPWLGVVLLAMSLVLVGCDSGPVVDGQATADMVEVLSDLDEQVDDGELSQVEPGFIHEVFDPLGEQAGRVYGEARARGRRPDPGAVASRLVTAAHGEEFPGLVRLFDTFTESEAYPEGSNEITRRVRWERRMDVMALGALTAADREAAVVVEQLVADVDDPYAAFEEYRLAESDGSSDDAQTGLGNLADELGDYIVSGWVNSPQAQAREVSG